MVHQTRNPTNAARIGNAAADRLLYCHALPLLRIASDEGGSAWRLANLLAEHGDIKGLRELANRLAQRGDLEDALAMLGDLAGDTDAAELLANLLAEQGNSEGLRGPGNCPPMPRPASQARTCRRPHSSRAQITNIDGRYYVLRSLPLQLLS